MAGHGYPITSGNGYNTKNGLAGVLKRGNRDLLPGHTQEDSDKARFARRKSLGSINSDIGDVGPQNRPGLHFKREKWTISWAKIKRKLMLASTGTPSSGEGRSESSHTSADSRQQLAEAYVLHKRNEGQDGQTSGNNGDGETYDMPGKQVHIAEEEDDWKVDQLVVDSEFWDDDGHILTHAAGSNSASMGHPHERFSNSGRSGRETATAHSDTASLVKGPAWTAIDGVITFFSGYVFPKCRYFFDPRFGDEEKEKVFRKERWYNTKRNAWFGSCFLVTNMILSLSLVKLWNTPDRIMWYGLYTLFTVPLPFLIAFDAPRKYAWLYSIWAGLATCSVAWYGIIGMHDCHFLSMGMSNCHGNQYLLVQYYAAAYPVMGLFAMHVNRFAIATGQLTTFMLICTLLLPFIDSNRQLPEKPAFARSVVNYLLFSIFIQYLHYSQEKIDRRMYTLRNQLKISYRAQQKAQIAEKKANNSKKRFISYIFHEVRVPLNTAYLAFQNLQANGNFGSDEDQMVEVYALESSLQQVQQVLNDVLDLQRMDAGRFESSSQPFHFHRAINALVASLKVATTAKKLGLDVCLDERIDQLPQSMDWQGSRATFVIGDEIRLRQVLTNLASNAVKFSQKGAISLVTKLIWPEVLVGGGQSADMMTQNEESSPSTHVLPPPAIQWGTEDITPTDVDGRVTTLIYNIPPVVAKEGKDTEKACDFPRDVEKEAGTEVLNRPPPERTDSSESRESEKQEKVAKRQCVIVRIEISDTGPGIKPSDLVDLRLFSPYVQTEVGRTQGGKGSGLGLAIVRAIVQLAHGRLGVQSSKKGSTFWLELRYPLALPEEVLALQEPPTPFSVHSQYKISTSTASDKPVRPPVKPYKAGESSWSQYSASKQNELAASSSQGIPPTFVEKDVHITPNLGQSLGHDHLVSGGKRASAAQSRHPSVASAGPTFDTSNTGIDTSSPFTSEQWQSPGLVERSLLPAMAVTSPTLNSASASQASLSTTLSRRTPAPSPPVPSMSGEMMAMISHAAPESPAGEEAFTPSTRQAISNLSPQLEIPPNLQAAPVPVGSGAPLLLSSSGEEERERPLTALIVDDDALTRKLMSRMMARFGCVVEEAHDGRMALDILLGQGQYTPAPRFFDIVTLDNMMPVLTGEQAIRVFRKAGRTDLVVGATGNALKADQSSYLTAGVDHVLCKPISGKDLKMLLGIAQKRRDEQDQKG